MCVCANPIYGWRVAWRKPLLELALVHLDVVPPLIRCEAKRFPRRASTAPWLLILIQSLSLQEAQERPLDSGDWIKPEEYDPDAKQVNAKEWAALSVT